MLNSWLKGRSCHPASLHRAPSSSVCLPLVSTSSDILYYCAGAQTHPHCHIHSPPLSLSLHLCPGGAEQRKTKLGAPKRRSSCPDHSGRFPGQSWDQDEESSGGGQEAPRTCREYLTHNSLSPNNWRVGLHMAHHLYPTVGVLFTSWYRTREQVGCTPCGVEKHS